jgi:hypothetical protein
MWVSHVAGTEEKKSAYGISVEERSYLAKLDSEGSIILKCFLKK